MNYTGTHESLFIKKANAHDLFEKTASIARMPDDDRMWPQAVLSNLFKQLPFITNYDVSINLDRIEPEAGFGFGNALIRSKKQAIAGGTGSQMTKIPLVISDRQLQPFHVMITSQGTMPLTAERMEQVMSDPTMFAGPQSQPKMQKSLVDELYPPYQQRQGFGRTVGAGAAGINKLAEALDDRAAESLSPKELRLIAKLKETEAADSAMRGLSAKERLSMAKTPALIGAGVGGALGVVRGMSGGNALKSGLAGVGTGLGVAAAGQLYNELSRSRRDAARRSGLYVDSPLVNKYASSPRLSESAAEFLAHKINSTSIEKFAKATKGRLLRSKLASKEDAPSYRIAESSEQSCGTCKYFQKNASGSEVGYCTLYDFNCQEQAVCDSWESEDSMSKEASTINMYWRRK